ncbi:MAG TPA: penicillin acylase family protein [Longimicrobiales bacterium]|nr:penicillin acylase family protein [Longimicrobiales bacterium]
MREDRSHLEPQRAVSVWPRARAWLLLLALAGCEATAAPGDFASLAEDRLPQIDGTIDVLGLQADVEVIRDPWGVPHIYAQNLDDLFFAQGFVQAQDRLWQMDMYVRAGQGRLSEIFGPEMLEHDRAARLFKYRGPWSDEEFSSYHPEGRRILEAFAAGVNAYIDHAEAAGELPVEYELTGLRPERWTAETPLLRIATAMPLGDARNELRLAQQVVELGAAEANRRANPTPYRDLVVPEGVDYSIITDEVIEALGGFEGTIVRPPLVEPYASWEGAQVSLNLGAQETSPGSNNWALSGSLTASGEVIVANDPHRNVANPSLRYVVHLDAPGWTAIGATEPVLPGVAIGHNGRVAWGLTIVGTDQSDVYIETVNPENPDEVLFQGEWEPLRIEYDTVQVAGSEPEVIELAFSRHGPIFYRDTVNHVAYAIRSTMHEPGTTGYLAALRLNLVDDCLEFLDELRYWKAPTENMVCGDAEGNISWQASALSPRREGWLGRLPVPGTGEYEWSGFREELPRELNPERGWVATANHDIHIHVPGYDPPLFFKEAGTFQRWERLREVLSQARGGLTLEDSKALQHDAYSAPAADALELFRGWTSEDPELEGYRQELADWDAVFRKESRAAAIFGHLRGLLPDEGDGGETFDPEQALATALQELREEQGDDPSQWRWGRINRSEFPHDLVSAYDLPAAERLGGAGTVAAIGATYREIIDFSNLDGSVATNAPGQSGRPGSPYYGNLIESWANAEYFPLSFSREAVEANAEHTLVLRAGG